MTREIVFSPRARDDLRRLSHYIAQHSGSARAAGYLWRIKASCMLLRDFPQRGTRRDDLRPGVRTIGFERRVTIAFRVAPARVTILRILYGGRDIARAVADE